MSEMGKFLIFLGSLLIIFGLLLTFFEKLPFGLGRLPGDIVIKRDGFTFYFPIVTSLIISVLLSLIVTLIFTLFKR